MKTVLLVGTADTKADELAFMSACLREQGVSVKLMDVGVLESTAFVRLGSSHGEASIEVGMIEKVAIANHEVAQAGGLHLDAVRRSTNENAAMQIMAKGAATLAAQAYARGDIHGLLALGGTMGTDLALDVAQSLPIGVPKLVLSTVAHSHLIAPERIAPDLITMLWAGGLYGLNELCKSALAQAAGACAGAVKAARPLDEKRPLIGMTSLGTSCLSYVVRLKPALEARGFEVAVFHSTGMGGRAFEALAAQGRFVAVLDLCLQELANHVGGSCVTSGPERLLSAGKAGIPQIVAPGAADMIDFAAWQPLPAVLAGRPVHEHNRLIASATSGPELRDLVARDIIQRLAQAK